VDVFVLDQVDAVEVAGLAPRASIELEQTVMRSYEDRQALAEAILSAHVPGFGHAAGA
jgi:hypothetical protein